MRIETPGLLTRNTLDKGELKKQLDWQILPIRYNDCRSTDTLIEENEKLLKERSPVTGQMLGYGMIKPVISITNIRRQKRNED